MSEYASVGVTLTDALWELRNNGSLCDVKFKTGQTEVSAHKNVLAVSNPYFQKLFLENPWLTLINIPETKYEVDEQTLLLFLEYLYSRRIYITQDNVKILFFLSKEFNEEKLQDKCLSFLLDGMSLQNCVQLFSFFSEFGIKEAKNFCEDVLFRFFHNYYITSEEIVKLKPSCISKLLVTGLGRYCTKENLGQFCQRYENKVSSHFKLPITVESVPTRFNLTQEQRECVLMRAKETYILYDTEKSLFLSLTKSEKCSSFKIAAFGIIPDTNFVLLEKCPPNYYYASMYLQRPERNKLILMNIFTEEIIDIPDVPRKKKEASALNVKRNKYHFVSSQGELYCIYGSKIELDKNMELIRTHTERTWQEVMDDEILFRKLETRTCVSYCVVYIMKFDYKTCSWKFFCNVAEGESENVEVYVLQKDCSKTFIFGLIDNKMSSFLFDVEKGEVIILQSNCSLDLPPNFNSRYPYVTEYNTSYHIQYVTGYDKIVVKHKGCSLIYSIPENLWKEGQDDTALSSPGLTSSAHSNATGLAFGFEKNSSHNVVKFCSYDMVTKTQRELCPPPFLKDGLPQECRTLSVPCELLNRLHPASLLCSPDTELFNRYGTSEIVTKWRKQHKED